VQPSAGFTYELDAIAAVVIGGTSLSGGTGGIPGTVIGVLIIGVLRNGLNLLGVSPFYSTGYDWCRNSPCSSYRGSQEKEVKFLAYSQKIDSFLVDQFSSIIRGRSS
jgi:hypothetical protein